MKYLTALPRKSSTVRSSRRMVRKPKLSVAAAGTTKPIVTSETAESSAAMHRMVKSRRLQSHRLAVALRLCG